MPDKDNYLGPVLDLDRPVASGTWQVPWRIELREEHLLWWMADPFDSKQVPGRAKAGGHLLSSFASLSDAPDEKILAFAKKWGVLLLCSKHWLPIRHLHSEKPCNLQGYGGGPYAEPIIVWRNFSKLMGALLRIAAALHAGKPGASEDWVLVLAPASDSASKPWSGLSLDTGRWLLGQRVDSMIEMSGVRPYFSWENRDPALRLLRASLFEALAIQLATAVGQADDLAICSHCIAAYIPRRRPREGEMHYCDDCRERRVPQQLASKRFRRGETRTAKIRETAKTTPGRQSRKQSRTLRKAKSGGRRGRG